MTAAAAAPATPGAAAGPQPRLESCPLCGTPLRPGQEWCLNCGAAARTRLAAAPNWRTPLAAMAVVAVLALGILAAALVKLAGDSGPAPATQTMTVTGPAAATTAPGAISTPTTAVTTSATSTPAGTAAAPAVSAPATPGATTTPGAVNPGAANQNPKAP